MTVTELINQLVGKNPNKEICLQYEDKETGEKVELSLTDNIREHRQCIDIEITKN